MNSARTRRATICLKRSSAVNTAASGSPGEPYYPVNDEKNGKLYARYKILADAEKNVIFGGRLAEYKCYDMDQVIAESLKKSEQVI